MDFMSLGLGAVSTLINAGVGVAQLVKAKQMARRNPRPTLGNLVVDDYGNLLDMYEQQAQYGIDPSALNFAASKNENALTATLQSMLLAGANPNSVGNAYSNFTDAMGNLAVQESERRWQKITALAPITQQLAEAKLQTFLYDKDAPYKDLAQTAAAKQNAGSNMILGSINSLLGNTIKLTAADNSYKEQNKILDRILNQKPTPTTTQPEVKVDNTPAAPHYGSPEEYYQDQITKSMMGIFN